MNGHELFATDPVLVIGVGNEYASDDAAGLLAARKLAKENYDGIVVLEHSGEGASLMEAWNGEASVIVIDAVRSGARPGEICRFDVLRAPLPAQPFRGSTHAFGLYEAVEVARSLGQLPQRLVIFGIEGANFAAGASVSGAVERALAGVVQSVLQEAGEMRRRE